MPPLILSTYSTSVLDTLDPDLQKWSTLSTELENGGQDFSQCSCTVKIVYRLNCTHCYGSAGTVMAVMSRTVQAATWYLRIGKWVSMCLKLVLGDLELFRPKQRKVGGLRIKPRVQQSPPLLAFVVLKNTKSSQNDNNDRDIQTRGVQPNLSRSLTVHVCCVTEKLCPSSP